MLLFAQTSARLRLKSGHRKLFPQWPGVCAEPVQSEREGGGLLSQPRPSQSHSRSSRSSTRCVEISQLLISAQHSKSALWRCKCSFLPSTRYVFPAKLKRKEREIKITHTKRRFSNLKKHHLGKTQHYHDNSWNRTANFVN